MTEAVSPWTCPFCPLLCDDMTVRVHQPGGGLELAGGDCALAKEALAQFATTPTAALASVSSSVNGQPCGLDDAIKAAVRVLAGSRQPLFAGLGTDVAGARALYRLACATGAICDAARGAEMMHTQRTLQDHGGFSTTLAEVRTRADLVVFIGGLQLQTAPRLLLRCGIGEDTVPDRHVVVLGGSDDDEAALRGIAGVSFESVPWHGDLFDTVATLGALAAGRALRDAPPGLTALADRLRKARYAVFVGSTSSLPAQGALIVESLHRTVGELNRNTRAAMLWVGGGGGASTVNQTFTWLSGLPLRSRAGPGGLEHEPLCFDATRLMSDGAVDALLWVSSFDTTASPPQTSLPRIILGHPSAAPALQTGADVIFIPVSTPGISAGGHLFRTDGSVVLPLFPVHQDDLPGVGEVLLRIHAEVVR